MFNLTVSEAHTYYVGQDGWLVHNTGPCNPVLIDTDAVINYKQLLATGRLKAGETPVITEATVAELNKLVAQGKISGLPKYLNEFQVISNSTNVNTRINVRGMQQQITASNGAKVKGTLFGDGVNGATALDMQLPFITNDKLLRNAVGTMGGVTR